MAPSPQAAVIITPGPASCRMKPSTGSNSPDQGAISRTRVVSAYPLSQRRRIPFGLNFENCPRLLVAVYLNDCKSSLLDKSRKAGPEHWLAHNHKDRLSEFGYFGEHPHPQSGAGHSPRVHPPQSIGRENALMDAMAESTAIRLGFGRIRCVTLVHRFLRPATLTARCQPPSTVVHCRRALSRWLSVRCF